jgi:hypothetical protein
MARSLQQQLRSNHGMVRLFIPQSLPMSSSAAAAGAGARRMTHSLKRLHSESLVNSSPVLSVIEVTTLYCSLILARLYQLG